jgi:hypothetical protein
LKLYFVILSLAIAFICKPGTSTAQDVDPAAFHFDFYGDSIDLPYDASLQVPFDQPLSTEAIQSFCKALEGTGYQPLVSALRKYQEQYKLDDWLYYQLIRKTAQLISPKAENYTRYTLYKWFLLSESGYNATLNIDKDKILFYVQSDENIYEIPSHMRDGKQFVCLNYHDYGSIDFDQEKFTEVSLSVPNAQKAFSYKITQLPNFTACDYQEKDLHFNVYDNAYQFKVKLNPQVQSIFANYPTVDYASYFNIPLSRETYSSLIPLLKQNIKGLNTKNGVDYLMRFTRYAFLFEPDTQNFGKEKRLTPEQTLFYEHSDCEDRAALFFYLVKEIYNLPMIVLSYPKHITIAVKFSTAFGKAVVYKGERYSVCEPTPQKEDLPIGQVSHELRRIAYEVVYAYSPDDK